ncbi:hypothetical protein [Enterobacter sp. ENT03]|uniref:hypothetical protein n=1 Tax=Enterobacter sp. ENT03 TaxID=2854780 RepID=UPI0035279F01
MNLVDMVAVSILIAGVTTGGVARIPEHAYLNASGMYNGTGVAILIEKHGRPENDFINPVISSLVNIITV